MNDCDDLSEREQFEPIRPCDTDFVDCCGCGDCDDYDLGDLERPWPPRGLRLHIVYPRSLGGESKGARRRFVRFAATIRKRNTRARHRNWRGPVDYVIRGTAPARG